MTPATAAAASAGAIAPPRLKLYEATEALDIVAELLEESEGELTPEIEELLAQAGDDFDAKAERVALKIRELETEANAIASEAQRLTLRATSRTRDAGKLREYLHREMQRAGHLKIKRPLATMWVQNNSSPSIIGADKLDETIVREFAAARPDLVKVVPETVQLSASKTIAAWKLDKETPLPAGVSIVQGTHLRIT